MQACLESLKRRVRLPQEIFAADGARAEVSYDPRRRCHLFGFPAGTKPDPGILSLFLCHAILAETVHPLFSCVLAEGPDALSPKVFEGRIWPVLSCTRTWFAWALWIALCPQPAEEDLRSRYRRLFEDFPDGRVDADMTGTLDAALVIAASTRFRFGNAHPGGRLGEAVRAFLQVNPEKAALDSLARLNAVLLRAFSSFTVRPRRHDGFQTEIWSVS
ncbi:MAG: hypothetical protein ACC613_04055 [Synergistales bacterium]